KTPDQVADKLNAMGIPATKEHVLTSSMATMTYLKEKENLNSVYLIGEEGLEKAALEAGFTITSNEPDAVVIGIDHHITYDKLAKASIAIQKGALFISTNSDVVIPSEEGLLPGNGALTSVLTTATGVQPTFIGKPAPEMMQQGLQRLKTSVE